MVSDSLSEPLLVHDKERGVRIVHVGTGREELAALSKTEPDLIIVQEQQEIIPITMYPLMNLEPVPTYLDVFGHPPFKKRANSYSRLTKYRHNKVRRRAGFHK